MKVCILAVTNASYGDYCIAGMTEEGVWVRPIPVGNNTRFWTRNQLTYGDGMFLQAGDVLEFEGRYPLQFQHKNHTEDFIVSDNLILNKSLTNNQLINFLQDKCATEQEFIDTVNANQRSLCLVRVDSFQYFTTQYENNPRKPKITLNSGNYDVTNPLTNRGDYIVKDCKWSSLILDNIVPNVTFTNTYVSIGLATPTPFNSVEYPQIIGLHTRPETPIPINYPV